MKRNFNPIPKFDIPVHPMIASQVFISERGLISFFNKGTKIALNDVCHGYRQIAPESLKFILMHHKLSCFSLCRSRIDNEIQKHFIFIPREQKGASTLSYRVERATFNKNERI